MSEYDPATATDQVELENGDDEQLDLQAEDEDDDYAPSRGYGGDDAGPATDSPQVLGPSKLMMTRMMRKSSKNQRPYRKRM